ncbi:cellulase family glycosylhydrolase [Stackebrandtia soli]|uniref:cellulase family glycosylhydrolase n=1 Tax=Stackebrandtia soli TaxID=1892856 RepID=UPI0039E98190
MRRARLATVLAVVGILLFGGAASALRDAPPTMAPRFITDDEGRALLLRGLNTASSAKSTPDGLPILDESEVEREYRDMGTNVVRFLLQWRTVEPEPGAYDDTYLAKVAERVEWYGDRGYHVILDMHQDLYGGAITPEGNVGNGAPDWATEMEGLPVGKQDQWEFYYLEPGVIRAFDNFWGTGDAATDLMRRYADAWGHVAEYFADDDTVLGYDLMNEPWGGSVQATAFENGPLAALYETCIDRIRRVDENGWIFLEPQAVGVNWGLPSSLPVFDDPRPGEDRIVFAPHLYPLPMDLGGHYDGDGKAPVDTTVGWWRDNVLRVAQRWNAPVFLGEFGLDATQPGGLDFVDKIADIADTAGMGWAYWSSDPGPWGPYGGNGERQPLVSTLDRAYPRAIAGTPTLIEYDADALRLSVAFTSVDGVTAPTEIYLPDVFGNGGTVDCGACTVSFDPDTRILSVTTDPTVGEHSIVVTTR